MPDTPRPLTPRQHAVLAFIRTKIRTQGFAPSLEEIAAHLGLRSLGTVHEHLKNLTQKGYIRRAFNEVRAIELTPRHGRCEYCGGALPRDPAPVVMHNPDAQAVDSYLATDGARGGS
jgi:SOS-response transcriptional repressor LexA